MGSLERYGVASGYVFQLTRENISAVCYEKDD